MNSGNQPTSVSIGSVTDVSGMVANVRVAVEIWSQARPVQFLFPFPVFVAAILIFGSQSTSGNVGRRRTVSTVAYPSRTWPKIWGRPRRWNRGAICHRSKVISTSGLMATILNLSSRTTSGNVRGDIVKSGMVDNMGIAVGIAAPSLDGQKLFSLSVFACRHLEFW